MSPPRLPPFPTPLSPPSTGQHLLIVPVAARIDFGACHGRQVNGKLKVDDNDMIAREDLLDIMTKMGQRLNEREAVRGPLLA